MQTLTYACISEIIFHSIAIVAPQWLVGLDKKRSELMMKSHKLYKLDEYDHACNAAANFVARLLNVKIKIHLFLMAHSVFSHTGYSYIG